MTRGTGGTVGWPGDGYPRGKQFLLIQRSHPHGGASLVDPLLDLSSPRSILFYPFSPGLTPFLSLSLFLSSLSRRASELGFCEQVLLHLPPSTVIHRILLFPSSRCLAKTISQCADRFDLQLVIAPDRSSHDSSTSQLQITRNARVQKRI